ncbi:MAG: hypothetical protein AAGA42_22280, partial [Actinomycetota bacterium]
PITSRTVRSLLLLVLGAVASACVGADAPDAESVSTSAPSLSTPEPATNPDLPDPATLRFQEPLQDDVVAFVNDPALADPILSDTSDASTPASDSLPRDASFVQMDGSDVVLHGFVIDANQPWDPSANTGDDVDIGIDGARFTFPDSGAIAYPVDGMTRIVLTTESASAQIDPDANVEDLVAVARTIGVSDDWNSAEIEAAGLWVFGEQVDGQAGGEVLTGRVVHDPSAESRSNSVSLIRFDEPVRGQQLVAFVADMLRTDPSGEVLDMGAEVGDTAIVARDGALYVELLSPVDVVVVGFGWEETEALLDLAMATGLDAAFDGSVDLVPRPAG